MKSLLTLTLVVLLAGSAFAQLDNSMGIFFAAGEFTEDATNIDTPATPFDAYICLVSGTMISVGAYEVSIDISDPTVFLLGVTGPNGWTNYGSFINQICGYTSPLPATGGDVVLATVNMLYAAGETVNVTFGPSDPSSVDGNGPAIADGANPDILYTCNYTSGPDFGGLVGTLNGDGIVFPGVAVESMSLSNVKALFN